MPGLSVHHQLLEFTQTHVHQVRDAIQPSHPLLSPSPPAPNPSQHQLHIWLILNTARPSSSLFPVQSKQFHSGTHYLMPEPSQQFSDSSPHPDYPWFSKSYTSFQIIIKHNVGRLAPTILNSSSLPKEHSIKFPSVALLSLWDTGMCMLKEISSNCYTPFTNFSVRAGSTYYDLNCREQ